MAERVGPSGRVVGIDLDAPLGAQAIEMLHGAGHRQCEFARVDLSAGDPLPGAPSLTAAGADVRVGVRLPELFAQAGAGAPDGIDVAGRLEAVAGGRW